METTEPKKIKRNKATLLRLLNTATVEGKKIFKWASKNVRAGECGGTLRNTVY
ncbi:mCG1028554 [Mus musculus]|nr:mCG1028554 [Mus musculus]